MFVIIGNHVLLYNYVYNHVLCIYLCFIIGSTEAQKNYTVDCGTFLSIIGSAFFFTIFNSLHFSLFFSYLFISSSKTFPSLILCLLSYCFLLVLLEFQSLLLEFLLSLCSYNLPI